MLFLTSAVLVSLVGCGGKNTSIAVTISLDASDAATPPTKVRFGIFNPFLTLSLSDEYAVGALPRTLYADVPAVAEELRIAAIAISDTSVVLRGATRIDIATDSVNRGVLTLSSSTPDFDVDNVPDSVDNCPTIANARQENMDGAGPGDACATVIPPTPDMAQCVPVTDCATLGFICGDASDGCGGVVSCGPCQLSAVSPNAAQSGTTLFLEGTFGPTVTVTFPGNIPIAATRLGDHRASVVVPSSATAGKLTIATGNQTITNVDFRRMTFQPGLQYFNVHYTQTDVARAMSVPATPRESAVGTTLGDHVYVIGGSDGATTYFASSERARINADSTLGPFNPTGALLTARARAAFVQTGTRLYVIGGLNNTGALASVESSGLDANGTLTNFTAQSSTLLTARHGACAVLAGSSVYVIGGRAGASDITTIERATLNSDGTLSAFAEVAGLTLAVPRAGHSCVVAGNSLYVIGGFAGGTTTGLSSVERAPIDASGALSTFAAAPSLATGRGAASTLVLGTWLYVIGGQNGTSVASVERAPIDSTNGTISTFALVAGLVPKFPRRAAVATVARNHLYLIGGADVTVLNSQPVEVSSIIATGDLGVFSQSTIPLPSVRFNHGTVALGNFLYLIGGEIDNQVQFVQRTRVAPDGAIEAFTANLEVLTDARSAFSLAVVGSNLYVIGGRALSNNTTTSVLTAPIAEDGTIGAFIAGPSLLTAREYARVTIVGANLFVSGGQTKTGGTITTLQTTERSPIASGALGAFVNTSSPSMTTVRAYAAGALISSTLSAFGGRDGTNDLSTTQEATITNPSTLGAYAAAVFSIAGRANANAIILGPRLYLIGGILNLTTQLTTVEAGTITLGGVLGTIAPLGLPSGAPTPYPFQTVAALSNYIYLLGGRDVGAAMMPALSKIERAEIN